MLAGKAVAKTVSSLNVPSILWRLLKSNGSGFMRIFIVGVIISDANDGPLVRALKGISSRRGMQMTPPVGICRKEKSKSNVSSRGDGWAMFWLDDNVVVVSVLDEGSREGMAVDLVKGAASLFCCRKLWIDWGTCAVAFPVVVARSSCLTK